jgi:hypothetical protein
VKHNISQNVLLAFSGQVAAAIVADIKIQKVKRKEYKALSSCLPIAKGRPYISELAGENKFDLSSRQ